MTTEGSVSHRLFMRTLRTQVEMVAASCLAFFVLRSMLSDTHAVTSWTVIMAVLATLIFAKRARESMPQSDDDEAMSVLVLPGDGHLREALESMLDDPDGQLCEECCQSIVPQGDDVEPVEFMAMSRKGGGTRYWHSECLDMENLPS